MYWSVSNIKYILAIRDLFAVSNEIKCKDLANLLGDSSVDFYEISKSLSRDGIIEMAQTSEYSLPDMDTSWLKRFTENIS